MFSKDNEIDNQYVKQAQNGKSSAWFIQNWCSWFSQLCQWSYEFDCCIPSFTNCEESMQIYQTYWLWNIQLNFLKYNQSQKLNQLISSYPYNSKVIFEQESCLVPVKTRRRNTHPPNIDSNLMKVLDLLYQNIKVSFYIFVCIKQTLQ